MEMQTTNCPMCPRHCSLDKLNCGKGKTFAALLDEDPAKAMELCRSQESDHIHKKHEHGNRRDSGHGFDTDPDSLGSLLHRCGRASHHGAVDAESIGRLLTLQEQETLKGLLKKLVKGLEQNKEAL